MCVGVKTGGKMSRDLKTGKEELCADVLAEVGMASAKV